jgi:hypothetical protein
MPRPFDIRLSAWSIGGSVEINGVIRHEGPVATTVIHAVLSVTPSVAYPATVSQTGRCEAPNELTRSSQ